MKFWFRHRLSIPALLLMPLSGLVWLVTRYRYRNRNQSSYPVPVVVIGNLTVGGTGKTPTIIWLVSLLQQQGFSTAVVSRGYRAAPTRDYPVLVNGSDTAASVGDEPKLIAQKTSAVVMIDPERHRAIEYLCALPSAQRPDVIISDDGMQHYRMSRDVEILMFDTLRGLGNGLLLPAGPLREPACRLKSVDFVLAKHSGPCEPDLPYFLASEKTGLAMDGQGIELPLQRVCIHTAIGNAESFRQTVTALGYDVVDVIAYRDHDVLPLEPLLRSELPILTTEKDAIKLTQWPESVYVLPYALDYDPEVTESILTRIKELIDEKRHHHSRAL